MYIEILDIHKARPITIEGERTLGREGAGADIPVADERVSGMHARIYPQGGKWFLEDLNSSNGTFIKGQQVAAPVELSEGLSFALCEYSFQVLRIASQPAGYEQALAAGEASSTRVGGSAAASASQGQAVHPGVSAGGPQREPTEPNPSTGGAPAPSARGQGTAGAVSVSIEAPGDPMGFVPAIMKALAYYLAAVPVMLFNPLGTVKKGIREQTFPAFGRNQIIAYAIPPLLFGGLLGTAGAFVAAIITKIRFPDSPMAIGQLLMQPLIAVAGAIIGAVITGFIFHPVLKWIINFLKGESDPKSRTNYFITFYTVMPIMALGGFIGAVLTVVPIPFVGLPQPLVQLVGTLISIFIMYSWFKYFKVVKWVPIVILVLGALAGVGAILGVVGQVRIGIAQVRGGGTGGGGVAGVDIESQMSAAIEAAKAAGTYSEEWEANMRKSIELAAANSATATGGGDGGTSTSGGDGGTSASAGDGGDGGTAMSGGGGGSTSTSSGDGGSATTSRTPPRVAGGGGSRSDFQEYKRRRGLVEKAIERDPPLLLLKGVRPLYKKLKAKEIQLERKYKVGNRKRTVDQEADARIADLDRQAETYRATVDIVDELFEKIIQ